MMELPAMVDATVQTGGVGALLFVTDPAEVKSDCNESLWNDTRLGIPLLFGFDVIRMGCGPFSRSRSRWPLRGIP